MLLTTGDACATLRGMGQRHSRAVLPLNVLSSPERGIPETIALERLEFIAVGRHADPRPLPMNSPEWECILS
jgi:hypothetical protein